MKSEGAAPVRIFLENMNFWGRHGILGEERKLGGPFRVDMEIEVNAPARLPDRISGTVDYRNLFSRTRAIMERRRFRTLEALAGAIAAAVMRERKVAGCIVKVTKLAPPLGNGTTAAVEVRSGSLGW